MRISQELKLRIEAAVAKCRTDEPTIIRNAVEAVCDHVEKHGGVFLPVELETKAKPRRVEYVDPAPAAIEFNEHGKKRKPKPPETGHSFIQPT